MEPLQKRFTSAPQLTLSPKALREVIEELEQGEPEHYAASIPLERQGAEMFSFFWKYWDVLYC